MSRARTLVVLAASVALLLPATAGAASSLDLRAGTLRVTGDAFRNEISVRRTTGGYVVRDAMAKLDIEPGSRCFFTSSASPPHEASCESASEAAVVIEGRAGDDAIALSAITRPARLDGENGDDVLTGGSGADILIGDDGADRLIGAGGNDTLEGDDGPDRLEGGPGIDTVTYADRIFAGVDATIPTDAVERRSDDGGSSDGLIPGLRDTIFEDVENLIGAGGPDRLVGGNSASVLSGGDGKDTLIGRGGDDRLQGGGQPDILSGGDGIDTASYAERSTAVTVTLDGRDGDGSFPEDVLLNDPAGSNLDNVFADVEAVQGGAGDDQLTGNGEANQLRGGAGEDLLSGLGGPDELDGGDDADSIDGGTGPDRLRGGSGTDTLTYLGAPRGVRVSLDGVADDGSVADDAGDDAGPDIENVDGTVHDDILRGNALDNQLRGGLGDDHLDGLGGNDRLDGGTGADVLDGGDGRDLATYADSQSGVIVTLDGIANDGVPGRLNDTATGERDDVRTDDVLGSGRSDQITGDAAANGLNGVGGDDTLTGVGGDDALVGGPGADTIRGDDGDDSVFANDGIRDSVACGNGADDAGLDLADLPDLAGPTRAGAPVGLPAALGCEGQHIAPVGELPTVAVGPIVRIHDHAAWIVLRCPWRSHDRCIGSLRLRHVAGPRLGAARFAIRRGHRTLVTVRLRRGARPHGRAEVVTREHARDGRPKTTIARARLRRG